MHVVIAARSEDVTTARNWRESRRTPRRGGQYSNGTPICRRGIPRARSNATMRSVHGKVQSRFSDAERAFTQRPEGLQSPKWASSILDAVRSARSTPGYRCRATHARRQARLIGVHFSDASISDWRRGAQIRNAMRTGSAGGFILQLFQVCCLLRCMFSTCPLQTCHRPATPTDASSETDLSTGAL